MKIFKPNSTKEINQIFREEVRVQIRGRNTKGFSLNPNYPVLSTENLNNIQYYNPTDCLVTVQPGISMEELYSTLAKYNQTVYLDQMFLPAGTVGGRLSMPSIFPLEIVKGVKDSHITRIEMCLPGWDTVSFGANTLKNVAGYHLEKLLSGTLGLLGCITSVTLRTYPLSDSNEIWLIECGSYEELREMEKLFMNELIATGTDYYNDYSRYWVIIKNLPKKLLANVKSANSMNILGDIKEFSSIVKAPLNYIGSFKVMKKDELGKLHNLAKKNDWFIVGTNRSQYYNILARDKETVTALNSVEDNLHNDYFLQVFKNYIDPRKVLC
ncbi:FAD-binding protein [Bacillus pseudomycoides]|uniref:FAD-binding oxidoreductase n=1 Tax=Bacillus pseudomycoides TaxID=64104 RepID=UPI001FB28F69|nr:FAD-binding protein [Bacillus pseudomycoides]